MLIMAAIANSHDIHLLEQFVLQLHVNGKQYSIKDPVMHSSSGTVPAALFEYTDMPESAIKIIIVVSHPLQKKENSRKSSPQQ